MKIPLAGPYVGAVAVNHERQIAEQSHAERARGTPGSAPLIVSDPLEVLTIQNLHGQLALRLFDRIGVAIAQRFGPLRPWSAAFALVKRPKQRVGVEPPALGIRVLFEG